MGGVGKTTLLTQINNKFLDTPNDFDVAIWVVVSKDLHPEKIQETIGKKIDLFDDSWKNKSLEEKAIDIFRVLRRKKFVLLLDDIWDRVDLTKLGVPLPSTKVSSRIIFTTRFIDVCGLMEAHKKFKVECLPDKEAWLLFKKKVGQEALDSHPDISELAKIVAKECGGLPLALITIGRAMACKKTPQEWSYAIQVLQRSASKFPGMGKEVYPLLKFSYDSLPSDTIRSCFFYCSLFPEDYKICKTELIDCWTSEGFLDEHDTRERNQGYYIIGILLHACLLEEEEENYVKMHDVLRDMSLWIACETEKDKENFLVNTGIGLTEAQNLSQWNNMRRISLMENQIEDLLPIPTCPRLLTLFLDRNNLKSICNGFFYFMPALKVLSLSNNRSLTTLPSGISCLVSLEHLDLSWTAIRELPKELISLVNLKFLNLDFSSSLRTIPRHVIADLSNLHVLKMFECGYSSKFLIQELFGLKNLHVLTITLRSFKALQRFSYSEKFQNCTESLLLHFFPDTSVNLSSLADIKHLDTVFIIECLYLEELRIDCTIASHVPYIDHTIASRVPYGFNSLQTVRIDMCSKLKDLTWLVLVPNLKCLDEQYCSAMEEIISVGKLSEVPHVIRNLNPFGKLQSLVLRNLRNMKSIHPNLLPFLHLREILVYACPKLQKLPLDSNSAKERKIVIKGQERWWKELQWPDENTQSAFASCFKDY